MLIVGTLKKLNENVHKIYFSCSLLFIVKSDVIKVLFSTWKSHSENASYFYSPTSSYCFLLYRTVTQKQNTQKDMYSFSLIFYKRYT